MTMPIARKTILERLQLAPARLTEEALRVEAAEAAVGTPSGEWSPSQVLAHLVAVEQQVWQARLAMLERDVEPVWTWTEPGPVDDPRTATVEGAGALFTEVRKATLARLGVLDEAGWARSGVHATYGRLDVAGLMTVAADHDDEHLAGLAGRGAPS